MLLLTQQYMREASVLLFSFGLSSLLLTSAEVNATEDKIQVTFQDNVPQLLDQNSKRLLVESGVPREKLDIIANSIQSYQLQRKESLGIQISTDFNRTPVFQSNSQIGGNVLSISPSTVAELADKYGLSSPHDAQIIESDIEKALFGFGFHSTEIERFRRLSETIFRTVNPLVRDVKQGDIKIINSLCPTDERICYVGKAVVNTEQLYVAVQSPDENALTDELNDCRTDQLLFDGLHTGLGSHNSPQEVPVDAAIWEAGKQFDKSCLEKVQVIEKLAVIKREDYPNDPVCGAYRVGPTQFVSALHCFQTDGRIDQMKVMKSSIFMTDNPTRPVSFTIANETLLKFNREYRGRVKADMPAHRDLAILDTEVFDDIGYERFENVIAEPIVGEKVVIPGYFSYHKDRKTNPSAWVEGIRTTRSIGDGYCLIYDRSFSRSNTGCLIHRCQAIGGYSGSPVLQEQPDGTQALVGVHVRVGGDYNKHCPQGFEIQQTINPNNNSGKPLSLFGNIAVTTTENLLIASGWNKRGGL
ncbi:hypothetical protein ACEWAS_05770 [Vibrio parahaemolyticus]|nr:hypothetical protein [Vibrio parahaemolyticus]HCG7583439.1 hypothetical protein [Vibrio parahaemolyticus]